MNEMAEKLTAYDPAEDLATDEAIATLYGRDPAFIAHALGVVARAKGMTHSIC
jgi:DNA-binding phage protein